MPKDAHSKAADHHDNAARSHRMAAEHRAKGDHAKGGRNPPGRTASRRPHTSTRRRLTEEPVGEVAGSPPWSETGIRPRSPYKGQAKVQEGEQLS